MESLAVSYAGELARWGVETSIIVPGSFTSGTNHFAHSGRPDDTTVEAEYETRYAGLMDQVATKLAALALEGASASLVSDEIARIIALPAGERPFRVHIDPPTTDPRRSPRSPTASAVNSSPASTSSTCSPSSADTPGPGRARDVSPPPSRLPTPPRQSP